MPIGVRTLALLMEAGLSNEQVLAIAAAIDEERPRTAKQARNARYYQKRKEREASYSGVLQGALETTEKVLKPTENPPPHAGAPAQPETTNLLPNERKKVSRKEPSLRSGEKIPARGTRMSTEWMPQEGTFGQASSELGIDRQTALTELVEFRDYWISLPGRPGFKLDWDRTFMNRLRQVGGRKRSGNGARASPDRPWSFNDIMSKLDGHDLGEPDHGTHTNGATYANPGTPGFAGPISERDATGTTGPLFDFGLPRPDRDR